ncbi:hypothetical protein A2U01_0098868, partial [Trifolium medium]|nr:hypothetical protein [Trifolium medium]
MWSCSIGPEYAVLSIFLLPHLIFSLGLTVLLCSWLRPARSSVDAR